MEILVAEDDIFSVKILTKILETMGHATITAENGLKAWNIFKEKHPRMIITDWMMPEMDGIALCRKIRETRLPYYVYVIILTARDRRVDAMDGFRAGADDYIVKPFEPEELEARIRSGQRIVNLEDDRDKVYRELLQTEKTQSVGPLAARVAHEMSSPIQKIQENTFFVKEAVQKLLSFTREQGRLIKLFNEKSLLSDQVTLLDELADGFDYPSLVDEIPKTLDASLQELEQIYTIVQSMKDITGTGT